jgi:hypothetical protein
MKKIFILISVISLFCCSREEDVKTDISKDILNNKSLRVGNAGGGNQFSGVFFAPLNTLCGGSYGQPASAISGLPYGIGDNVPRYTILVTANLNSTLQGGNAINVGKADLSALIVSYLESLGITIEEDPIYGNNVPASSYFTTMNYETYTFADNVPTIDDFLYLKAYSFMDRDVASAIIQNVYIKIINDPHYLQNNQIKAIRIYYDAPLCMDPERDLKINVVY